MEEKTGEPTMYAPSYQDQQVHYPPTSGVNPPYVGQVPAVPGAATEVNHHGSGYSSLTNEGGEEPAEDIPSKGPGGIPQKYFSLDFEDCFTEHEKTRTLSPLYKVLGVIYKYTKLIFYHIFVIVFGIPLTFVWALTNGIIVFYLVWIWGPVLRLFIVLIYSIAPAVTTPVQALLSPLVDVLARIFRQCRIKADIGGNLGRRLTGQEHIA